MLTVKKATFYGSVMLIVAIGGYGIYEWFIKQQMNASTVFFLFLVHR